MGLTSLDAYDDIVGVNRRNYDAYVERLSKIPGLRVFHHDGSRPHNFHYVVVDIDEEVLGLSRDEVVKVLEAENVLARRYFYPGAHDMEPYRSNQPMADLVLPETKELTTRVMTLPTGGNVDQASIELIGDIIARAVDQRDGVRAHCTASRP